MQTQCARKLTHSAHSNSYTVCRNHDTVNRKVWCAQKLMHTVQKNSYTLCKNTHTLIKYGTTQPQCVEKLDQSARILLHTVEKNPYNARRKIQTMCSKTHTQREENTYAQCSGKPKQSASKHIVLIHTMCKKTCTLWTEKHIDSAEKLVFRKKLTRIARKLTPCTTKLIHTEQKKSYTVCKKPSQCADKFHNSVQ